MLALAVTNGISSGDKLCWLKTETQTARIVSHNTYLKENKLSKIYNNQGKIPGLSVYSDNRSYRGKMQHKVNFSVEYSWFEFKIFLLLDRLSYQD